MTHKSRFPFFMTLLGYGFLYIPLLILLAFSFNASKSTTVWSGFSTHWYGVLFKNAHLMEALQNSLKVAFFSSSMAVVMALLAAISITRLKPFWGRNLFKGLLSAPLVMPEVVMGLAFLLIFIFIEDTFGLPFSGGLGSIAIAHTTIAMAYVTAILTAQLSFFDDSLREAALDLGAPPFKVFFVITLPIIYPSLIGGWLLAFVLSFDDVVVASFVGGPEATTLPMVIFSSIRFGVSPEINALATLLIVGVAFLIFVVAFLTQRQKKLVESAQPLEEPVIEVERHS